MLRLVLIIFTAALLVACDAITPPTLTPTRNFSAATLAPSPTVGIFSSDILYGDDFSGQNNLTAAALPSSGGLPPLAVATRAPDGAEAVQVVMPDGVVLGGEQYQYISDRLETGPDLTEQRVARVPGVLILAHARLEWHSLAQRLHAAGYNVLTVDMRQIPRADDVATLLEALSELSTVDPARLVVMGAGVNADTALLGCATHALCDAAALLSPRGANTLANVMATYNPRPVFVAAARDDEAATLSAQAIQDNAGGSVDWRTYETGQGTDFVLLYPEFADTLVNWLRAQW